MLKKDNLYIVKYPNENKYSDYLAPRKPNSYDRVYLKPNSLFFVLEVGKTNENWISYEKITILYKCEILNFIFTDFSGTAKNLEDYCYLLE